MKIIKPYYKIELPTSALEFRKLALEAIERAARTCYKSEDKIKSIEETSKFVRKIIQVSKHESVMEHVSITIRFICDRGVSHELVRHRIAAYSQESTRYCNYCDGKFDGELTFIRPCFWDDDSLKFKSWLDACQFAEHIYKLMIDYGASPQEARSVLPNSLKTEIVMTCNLREWRHVFKLRTANAAHPQMRELMRPLCEEFKILLPEVFDDITY